MYWQGPVLARVVAAHMITPILSKKLAGARSRTRSIRLMYFMCALFAGMALLIAGTPLVLDRSFQLVFVLGIANCFALYSVWRAQDISLSRQALFTMMDDVIPVVMGYFLLGEKKFFSPMLASGVAICFVGVAAFSIMESRKKAAQESKKGDAPLSIFVWIGIYSVIWGVAHFAQRYYAFGGMPTATFVCAWYGGSFIGANLLISVAGKKEKGDPLPRKQIVLVVMLAALIAICLALEYWASKYAPLAVTQPIFQVTEMIFPTLLGLFYFKEIKEFTGKMGLVFAIAFVGSLLVALSY